MTPEPNPSRPSRRATLVADALEAAFGTIELLKLLHETAGLARASYVEFTSCRASLLLLLAQSVNQRTERLATSVELGLRLIKSMTTGNNASAVSDTSVIETIELGVRRLHSQRGGTAALEGNPAGGDPKTGYDRFREWTALWKDVSNSDAPPVLTEPQVEMDIPDFSAFQGAEILPWPETAAAAAVADPMTWTAPVSDDLQTGSFLNIFPDNEAAEVAMMANLDPIGEHNDWSSQA